MLHDGAKRLSPVTHGFEHVSRFYNAALGKTISKILPGEYYVSHGQDYISTVLGSCVAACVRDTRSHIGAMNHFMLPDASNTNDPFGDGFRYGAYAMEHMLNHLYAAGVRKEHLEVKIVGGGAVMGTSDIGAKNIDFVQNYLDQENLHIAAQDVGEHIARNVMFDVVTGKMKVKRMAVNEDVISQEQNFMVDIKQPGPTAGGVELF